MEHENVNDRIRKFIIKNTIGRIKFSADDNSFRIILRPTKAGDYEFFRKEISQYDEWKNQTPENIDNFVNITRCNASLCNERRSVTYPTISLNTLKEGFILDLKGKDDRLGDSNLRIMYLGKVDNGSCRFFVLETSRLALHRADVLEPYDTSLWSTGFPICFKVYRNGKRIPEHTDKVYQTFPIENISLITPSIVQEVIDAQSDFSFDEINTIKSKHSISFEHSPMGLLMHEFSSKMPFYADFEQDGIVGTFSNNVDNKDIEKTEFCETKDGSAPVGNHITQLEPGKLRFNVESNKIDISEKIKCQ